MPYAVINTIDVNSGKNGGFGLTFNP